MASRSISEQVITCLEQNRSFIVDAGAGSGKTHTLVEALSHLLAKHSDDYLSRGQQIICITYTNVAVDEIKSRINDNPLVRVSTIHDFLWSVIGNYKMELRKCILDANDENEGSKRIVDLDLTNTKVEYWQYGRKWQNGKINHDDVIYFASRMFILYPKLSRLVADRYPVIFVDEYQDTQEVVVNLLLNLLTGKNKRCVTLGFFGDHMQKIYGTGIGKLERPELESIQKLENYRCSNEVIRVLNNLRPTLQQVAAGGKKPQGSARFFYSHDGNASISTLQARLQGEGWEPGEKILMLTRKSIAKSLGWENLRRTYDKRRGFALDDLLRGDDAFSYAFQTIEDSIAAFDDRRYGDLYKLLLMQRYSNDERFSNPREYKLHFSQYIRDIKSLCRSATIGQVLEYIWDNKIMVKTNQIADLEDRSRSEELIRSFLDDLRDTPYTEVSALYRYLNNETPFSTKHSTKGEEYDNVIVVINDGSWNQYNFASVLEENTVRRQYERSLNLFYVCCSRARNNLAVLMESKVSNETIRGARRIFGDQHVIEL
jgi:DNA helicase II